MYISMNAYENDVVTRITAEKSVMYGLFALFLMPMALGLLMWHNEASGNARNLGDHFSAENGSCLRVESLNTQDDNTLYLHDPCRSEEEAGEEEELRHRLRGQKSYPGTPDYPSRTPANALSAYTNASIPQSMILQRLLICVILRC